MVKLWKIKLWATKINTNGKCPNKDEPLFKPGALANFERNVTKTVVWFLRECQRDRQLATQSWYFYQILPSIPQCSLSTRLKKI